MDRVPGLSPEDPGSLVRSAYDSIRVVAATGWLISAGTISSTF